MRTKGEAPRYIPEMRKPKRINVPHQRQQRPILCRRVWNMHVFLNLKILSVRVVVTLTIAHLPTPKRTRKTAAAIFLMAAQRYTSRLPESQASVDHSTRSRNLNYHQILILIDPLPGPQLDSFPTWRGASLNAQATDCCIIHARQ